MKYYLPDELVLIVVADIEQQIDFMQPEKNGDIWRKDKSLPSFACLGGPNGPTEWTQVAFGVDRHHCRWRWTL